MGMYSAEQEALIATANARILSDMAQHAPFMAESILPWLKALARSDHPEEYFKHPLAFPALLLPWWVEQSLGKVPDTPFQTDLAYSTMNGYYFIRMTDNIMDGHATVEQKLLPALSAFHTQFEMPYHRYFNEGHPFWDEFRALWLQSSEFAMKDSALTEIDEAQFADIAGKKVCAGKIPMLAVCYHYEQPQLVEAWMAFFDRLGCWHQMYNDVFDWIKDLQHNTPSYFLSEIHRRKAAEDSIPGYVIHHGFAWGIDVLQGWLRDLKERARTLTPDLLTYLEAREAILNRQVADVTSGFDRVAALFDVTH